MHFRRTAILLLLTTLSLPILCQRGFSQGGLDQAAPIGQFLNGILPPQTPRTADGNWILTNAFPNLNFREPVQMIPVPGANQFLIVETNGRLVSFENDPVATTKTILLDITAQVQDASDSGMLGAAFHPEFSELGSPNRDFVYVFYRYSPNLSIDELGYCRLSRFTWLPGAQSIDPASEFVLINQYDRHNWHNGGGIFFGPDGFLYLSIGDEGGPNDLFDSGQKTNLGLLSGVLRIDVDQDLTRSHPIIRQPLNPATPPAGWPDSFSQGYTIPNDNPWLSPGGSDLEEFYAIGLRSPHRMTHDPVTNRIWLGDVGQNTKEEVDLILKGANLQWPYREADISGPMPKPDPLTGFDQPPVWSYDRTQGGCVIGGYVYRGSAHPDLYGKYLFGDHNNGFIRALTYTPGQPPQVEDLVALTSPIPGEKDGISGFGVDTSGEIYVLCLAAQNPSQGEIYELGREGPAIPEPPALLSQTGAFQDLASLTPNSGIIPYDLIQPLWSDGAAKKRWIAIPNDGLPNLPSEQIGFSETGEWTFPIGTVLIKHFEFAGRRLETRFLVHGTDNQYYGLTYRWRPDNLEADLLPGPPVDEIIDLGGGQSLNWHFPGRTECFNCHTQAAGTVLGLKTRHLNRDLLYPVTGRISNQLTTFNQLGFLSPAPAETDIPGFLTAANVTDLSETLDRRARSYLDINCSQCHRPGGPTQAAFDTRFTTSAFFQNMIDVDPINDLGIPGAKIIKPQVPAESVLYLRLNSLDGCCAMPPLAKNAVDADAVQALAAWINSLDPSTAPGLRFEYYDRSFTQLPDFSAFAPDLTGVVANFDLSPRLHEDDYAFRFLGDLNISAPGEYTIHLSSDDGSRLLLNGVQVIDNDGTHSTRTESATVTLSAGIHPLEVDFFEYRGDANLSVEIEGPGLLRQPIPNSFLTHQTDSNENQAPDLVPVPDQSTEVNQTVNLSLSASDPENDTLTFAATGLPAGLSLDPATGAFTGAPTTAAIYNVTVIADDGQGNGDTESFTWTITNPAGGPQPGLLYDYYQHEFTQLPDFSSFAPDQTGVVANFNLSPRLREDAFAFRFLGALKITAPGDYTLHLTSDDGSRLILNGALLIDNDGQHGDQTVSAAVTLGIGDHPIEVDYFEFNGGANLAVEIEGPGLLRQLVPDTMLSHVDSTGANQPPNLTAISDQSTVTSQPVNLILSASDPENDPLTFAATGLPAGLTINPSTGLIAGSPTVAGFFDVTVTVSDGSGGDTETFKWTVTNPPGSAQPGLLYEYYHREFTQLPDFSAFAPDLTGAVANFDLSPRLREDAYAFRYLGDLNISAAGNYTLHLTSDDGSRLWLNGALLIDNDGQHGNQTVSAPITLGEGVHPLEVAFFEYNGSANLIVEIEGPGLPRQSIPDGMLSHNDSAAGNLPPNLSAIPAQIAEVDQPFVLSLSATDPENDPLTFAASGLPAGMSINPATGEITGTATTPGFFFVTVTVNDGNGGGDTESFTWTVMNPVGSPQPGLFYQYYHGAFTQLPDFSVLTPVKSGTVPGFDLSPRLWEDHYAFQFLGNLEVATAGNYTFYLTSDDGSRLWIDSTLVVNNDGLHGAFEQSGTVTLTAGAHSIEVAFFENLGGASLAVEIEGPGLPRQAIPGSLLTHSPAGGSESGNNSGTVTPPTPGATLPGSSGNSSLTQSRTRVRFQPDNWIGKRLTFQRGDNIYNTSGRLQTITLKLPNHRTRSFFFTVQNDRRVPDSLVVRASRQDKNFKLTYLELSGKARNISGKISVNGFKVTSLPVDARLLFQTRVKPSRKLKTRRGHRRLSILSTSTFEGLGQDRIKAILRKTR